MISKELKSQLSILKETNPEYIQTLKDAVMASYKAELQAHYLVLPKASAKKWT